VPKIVKSCLNLSKLRPKYYESLFTGHGVYAYRVIEAKRPKYTTARPLLHEAEAKTYKAEAVWPRGLNIPDIPT